jgi:quinol monooxygenase YgiN
MPNTALFIRHATLPGKRDAVEQVWRKHMMPAITANEGHVAYFYCFGTEPDTICAFQQYRDEAAAAAFLKTPAYAAYIEEVTPLLTGEPAVSMLDIRWTKQPEPLAA